VLDPGGPPFVLSGEKDWGPGQVVKSAVLDAQNWRFDGGYGNVNNGPWTNFTVNRSELTGPPTSPQDVIEMRWPTSLSPGVAPFLYQHFLPALASRIWIAMTIWIDPQWTNNANAATKLVFFRLADRVGDYSNSNTNHYVNLARSSVPPYYYFGLDTQFLSGTGTNVGNIGGVSSNVVSLGQWHVVELYLQLNSAPGVADGIYQVAIDGVLRSNRSDVIYLGPGTPANVRFNRISFNPTYGGLISSPPYNLYCYMDHIRFKSAP
jgi:hypothetical protein